MNFSVPVDSNLIDQVEEEVRQISFYQFSSDAQRMWDFILSMEAKFQPILRMIGLVAAIIGLLLTAWINLDAGWHCYFANPRSSRACAALTSMIGYTLFCAFGVVFLYFWPAISNKINYELKRFQDLWGDKLCRLLAQKAVKNARGSVPCRAEYIYLDGTLQYCLHKEDVPKVLWSRPLKGVAIYGDSVTVFYETWTAVQPIMIVIHNNFAQLEPVLRTCQISFRPKV